MKATGCDVWSESAAGGEKMGAQGRKRKLFTGVAPIGGRSVRSLREARRITSQFHELNNQIGKINPKLLESDEQQELKKRIEEEIVSLGGRNRYQQASVVTTTHHKVSLLFPSTTIAHILLTRSWLSLSRPANGSLEL
jgi:hypothetical protein